jgi:DNA-binding NtrC family response regulator
MHYPQLLVYETDRRLAMMLQPLADKRQWLLREPRQLSACLRLLDRRGPGVMVVRLSRDLERELAMLEQVAWLHPETAILLVVDAEQMGLSSLAWDLGVCWILPPPHARERVTELTVHLMRQFEPPTAMERGGE